MEASLSVGARTFPLCFGLCNGVGSFCLESEQSSLLGFHALSLLRTGGKDEITAGQVLVFSFPHKGERKQYL